MVESDRGRGEGRLRHMSERMMNLTRGLILPIAICAVLLLPFCGAPSPETWPIASLRVSQSESPEGLSGFTFEERALRDELSSAIVQASRFAFVEERKSSRGGQGFQCRLEVVLAHEAPSRIVSNAQEAEVGVIVELWRAEGETRLMAEGVGQAPFALDGETVEEASRQAAFRRALQQAIGKALDAHRLQLEALGKKTAELIADLESSDMRRRDYAIRALGERREMSSVEPLIARLSEDEEPALVLRAAGALGNLGDARAIPALIEAAERESLPAKAAFLAIIALIGGPTAEGYLFVLSGGHPSEDVRRLARLHLDTLEKREQAALASSDPVVQNTFEEEPLP